MKYHHNNIDAITDEHGEVVLQNINPQWGQIIEEFLEGKKSFQVGSQSEQKEIEDFLRQYFII